MILSTSLFLICAISCIGRMGSSDVYLVFIFIVTYELRYCGVVLFPYTHGSQNHGTSEPFLYLHFCCMLRLSAQSNVLCVLWNENEATKSIVVFGMWFC